MTDNTSSHYSKDTRTTNNNTSSSSSSNNNDNNNSCCCWSFTGAEPFLVGLAPSFWAHVPLLICQIQQNLEFHNGIHVLRLPAQNNDTDNNNNNKNNDGKLIPISKCCLQGCIVAVEERRGNGNNNGGSYYQFVLDDGTDWIDCRYYARMDDFALPSLTDDDDDDDQDLVVSIVPGQMVRVMGRIKCLNHNLPLVMSGQEAPIREIHSSLVLPLVSPSRGRELSLDSESYHWLQCVQFFQNSCNYSTTTTTAANTERTSSSSTTATTTTTTTTITRPCMVNALDVLEWLGPNITSQVYQRHNLPSADDTEGAWRLFGTQCPCSNDSIIKKQLLYCHCIATAEPLDQNFVFRDALLEKLLGMERQQHHDHQQQQQQSICRITDYHSTNKSTANSIRKYENEQAKKSQSLSSKKEMNSVVTFKQSNNDDNHLRFQYQRDLANDPKLFNLALQVISSSNKNNNNNNNNNNAKKVGATVDEQNNISEAAAAIHAKRLMLKTVAALRKDGILYLLDAPSDTYLLISRHCVLEPYIERVLKRESNDVRHRSKRMKHDSRPLFLNNVPSARLELVRRSILLKQRNEQAV